MPYFNPFSIADLITAEPRFFSKKPVEADTWKKVRNQAGAHMRREGVTVLFDIQRPDEPDEIRDYRDTIRRDLTSEGSWKFISKVTRVFLDNGIKPDEDNMSDEMRAFLEEPFYVTGTKRFSVVEFMYKVLLPFMIEDPNGFLVPFPFNEANPDTPPAFLEEDGGLSPLERVSIENILISSADVVFLSDNIMAWRAGEMEYKKGSKAPYFYMVDTLYFIRYVPILRNQKLEYEAQIWYFHGLNQVPVQQMGGVLTRFEDQPRQTGEMIFYYESFLRPYFHYADEFVTRFSDNQAVFTQHAYPKQIMDPIPCVNTHCREGKVRITDPETGEVMGTETCPVCKGAKYLTNPGPYRTLIREKMPGVENNSKVLEYVSPPVDILVHSYEVSFDLLTKGKKTIGLDLLENVQESGVAKSMRLDDLRDFLWQIASAITRVMEGHLSDIEAMINIIPADQIDPTVYLPQIIHFTNRSLLKEEAQSAISGDRMNAALAYLRQKYRDDDVKFKIYYLSYRFAPLLLMDANETSQALAAQAYDQNDIIRRDRIVDTLTQISDVLGASDFLDAEEATLLEVAEVMIEPFFPAPLQDFFDIPFSGTDAGQPPEGGTAGEDENGIMEEEPINQPADAG